jgi:hypothetical protein
MRIIVDQVAAGARRLALAVAATALLLGGCEDGAGPGVTPPPTGPIDIPVAGHGPVTERYSAEVAVAGDWAYTTTWGNRGGVPGNAVKIWNVGGQTPVLVDSIIADRAHTVGDVQISDNGAILAIATEGVGHGSLILFDRTSPHAPRRLAVHASQNTVGGVHTVKLGRVNGVLYAFLSVNPFSGQPPRLVVLDLSDPAAPGEVLAQAMGQPIIHDVFVRDGWLFTALWNEGLVIWDIGAVSGSPAAPRRVGGVRTVNGRVHNVWWFHDPSSGGRRYAFVGDEGPMSVLGGPSEGDIHVVDITDMSNPREVAFYTLAGAGTHNFSMDEQSGILYAAYYNGGVRALDVRGDLGSCTAAQRAPDGRCDLGKMGREVGSALAARPGTPRAIWGVVFAGDYLFATDMLSGLYKLDVRGLRR